jgi:hypothetical protein
MFKLFGNKLYLSKPDSVVVSWNCLKKSRVKQFTFQSELNDLPLLYICMYVIFVGEDIQVGIDVEERERKFTRDLMALARRQFSPEEADWLSQFTDPNEQRCQFIQLWTLKVDTN